MNLATSLGQLVAVCILGWAADPVSVRPRPEDALAFPRPQAAVEIPVTVDGRAASLLDLVRLYGSATDQRFLIGAEVRNHLEQTDLGLDRPLSVSPEALQRVFELFLAESDFLLSVANESQPRLLRIHGLMTGERTGVRTSARFVPAERVDLMRAHPALLLTTVVDLPRLDVRQLSNSMRTMITDANTQQMLPAGNSNAIVLTARGSELAELVELFGRLDEVSVPPPPVVPETTPGEGAGGK